MKPPAKHRPRGAAKVVLACLTLLFLGAGAWCFQVSAKARLVVRAVEGPPLFTMRADFSKPFTNSVWIDHVCLPFYGTTYISFHATPSPSGWASMEAASEKLAMAAGEMTLENNHGDVFSRTALIWRYDRFPHSHPEGPAPLQSFLPDTPLGRYRLSITTRKGLPELEGKTQELEGRYDMLHEGPIARGMAGLGAAFVSFGSLGALFLACLLVKKRSEEHVATAPPA